MSSNFIVHSEIDMAKCGELTVQAVQAKVAKMLRDGDPAEQAQAQRLVEFLDELQADEEEHIQQLTLF